MLPAWRSPVLRPLPNLDFEAIQVNDDDQECEADGGDLDLQSETDDENPETPLHYRTAPSGQRKTKPTSSSVSVGVNSSFHSMN